MFQYRTIARVLAWIGAAMIIALSVVPAVDRPVTEGGQSFEHFSAFALVAGMFALGYRLSLVRRLYAAVLFCSFIELLQIPLPTRHARISDFVIDIVAMFFAIALVYSGEMLICIYRRKAPDL